MQGNGTGNQEGGYWTSLTDGMNSLGNLVNDFGGSLAGLGQNLGELG